MPEKPTNPTSGEPTECDVCGAAVVDAEKHEQWHRQVAAGLGAADYAAGMLRPIGGVGHVW